jgi:2-keto-3-deoxy-L-rhamnonate aldolase RhmA
LRNNTVREKLRSGRSAIGCFMGLGSPTVAEMLAHAGFDYLVIETEHNALDSAEIEHMLMAMNGTDTIPIVRIASANPVFIQRALDIGAMGIVVPLVRTAAEAEAIVRATRYPPQGTRSFGGLRASHFTFDNHDYFYRANDNLLITLILETKEAIENIEAIAAVPGIDVLMFGYFDLCLSFGLDPMKQPYPEIDAITERVLDISRKTGVTIGATANTPEGVNALLKQGIRFLGYGPDYTLMANAVRPGIAAFRELTA